MKTLYDSDEIVLDQLNEDIYRVTFFNKDLHWAGDLTFNKHEIICNELIKDDSR